MAMATMARKMTMTMKKIINDVNESNDGKGNDDIQGILMTRMMHL